MIPYRSHPYPEFEVMSDELMASIKLGDRGWIGHSLYFVRDLGPRYIKLELVQPYVIRKEIPSASVPD